MRNDDSAQITADREKPANALAAAMHYSLLIRSRKKPAVVRTNVGVASQPKIELKGSIAMVTRLSRGLRFLSDEKRAKIALPRFRRFDDIDQADNVCPGEGFARRSRSDAFGSCQASPRQSHGAGER